MFNTSLVLGACGAMGRLVSESFNASGIEVIGVDLNFCDAKIFHSFLRENVADPSAELLAQVQMAECLVVCLPEEVGLSSAAKLAEHLPAGALWVDTFSVKGPIAKVLEKQTGRLEILSINPMFAPSLGWRGKPVAVVELSSGSKADSLKGLIGQWGSSLEPLGAVQHDQATAAIQVATHAAALAFGAALLNLDYDASVATRLATPPHKLLLTLLHRIVSQNPEVYWEIQRDHPSGTDTRTALKLGLERVSEIVERADRVEFQALFESLREVCATEEATISQWSRQFLAAPATQTSRTE